MIEFKNPPADTRSGAESAEIAEALRARPGEWALIRSDTYSSTAANIKNGGVIAYQPAGSFEAVCRKGSKVGKFDVYARFVGEVSA